MNREQKNWIELQLRKLPFVKWDRFFSYSNEECIFVFGWIDREKDNYKDYVSLEINVLDRNVIFCSTSNALRSKEIADKFELKHNDCERVENNFNIPNMIKLKEGKCQKRLVKVK